MAGVLGVLKVVGVIKVVGVPGVVGVVGVMGVLGEDEREAICSILWDNDNFRPSFENSVPSFLVLWLDVVCCKSPLPELSEPALLKNLERVPLEIEPFKLVSIVSFEIPVVLGVVVLCLGRVVGKRRRAVDTRRPAPSPSKSGPSQIS